MSKVRRIVTQAISQHLADNGFRSSVAAKCAQKGYEHFEKAICNSKDPFKDACDHAGGVAETMEPDIKYKPQKSKLSRRSKKPQEAFNF